MQHFEPAQYMRRMADAIDRTPRCALWLKMGQRKTAITLMAIRKRIVLGEVERVLVVAPKRVAQFAWPQEIEKWDAFSDITYTVIKGDASWRLMLSYKDSDVHTITYDSFAWLVKHRGKDWPYDWIVFDESSRLKNSNTSRFKAAKALLSYLEKRKRRYLYVTELTGTHAPNSLHDTWSQLFLLDNGERLGATLGSFRERWFTSIQLDNYVKRIAHEHAAEQIGEAVSDIVFTLAPEEAVQLPGIVYNRVLVPLAPAVMQRYKEFERDMLLKFEEAQRTHSVVASNAATLTGKCLQFASGAVFTADELGSPTKEWVEVHTAKLDALESIIEEAGGDRILVVYWFKHDLARIRARLPHARVLKSDADMLAWNRREIEIGLINPGSAGHGLNLQDGGSTLVWFTMQWSLELYQQTNARLHRSGQTDVVTVHLLMAEGTIDEDVPDRLEGKATIQEILERKVRKI